MPFWLGIRSFNYIATLQLRWDNRSTPLHWESRYREREGWTKWGKVFVHSYFIMTLLIYQPWWLLYFGQYSYSSTLSSIYFMMPSYNVLLDFDLLSYTIHGTIKTLVARASLFIWRSVHIHYPKDSSQNSRNKHAIELHNKRLCDHCHGSLLPSYFETCQNTQYCHCAFPVVITYPCQLVRGASQ